MVNNFLEYLKERNNVTNTENGAIAFRSTMNACLDAFASLGAMKESEDSDIIRIFSKAFTEDRVLATRMLFYMRDIRGGQGTRRVFRVILKWLAYNYPDYVVQNLENVLFYGRGDDILDLLDTPVKKEVINFIKRQLQADYEGYKAGKEISLLCKWLPSENASSVESKHRARCIASALNWAPRNYRKLLSLLRKYVKVTEIKMSAREWNNINYEAVPAKAAINYRDAFNRHDHERYTNYLKDIALGKAKVNAASLFPVDIVSKILSHFYINENDRILYDTMWKALPNYCADSEETGICVVDTSGSMDGNPMAVALSLGMYCADKCHGPYANHFITFSSQPELVEFKGRDIVEKIHNAKSADWGANTNLEAVFDLILNTAVQNHCKPQDLPAKLYIISDMQFDAARTTGYTYDYRTHRYVAPKQVSFMESMKHKYQAAGYEMPTIVYWNVRQSNCGMFQSTFDGENCCMVSGYSPTLFKSIVEGTTYEEVETLENGVVTKGLKAKVDPMVVMATTIGNERYDRVWTGNK